MLLVAVGLALVLGVWVKHRLRPGDVFHPRVPFQAAAQPQQKAAPHSVPWPMYGYSKDHARYYPAPPTLRPPFKRIWTLGGDALLEFPPALDRGTLYQLNDSAVLHAVAADTGRVRWQRKLGHLSASAPAAGGDTVYATVLRGWDGAGRIVALRQRDGHPRWGRSLSSRSESSPLLDRGRVFFGSQNGTVYALDAHNGHVAWTYRAADSVKASPTLFAGRLYFGDYGGHMQAVWERTGRRAWLTGGKGLLGGGNFYSTPAVAFGRVYAGNTDGRVYAFDAANGHLAWAKQTGAYVYSSPAVANPKGLGPTVYVGSYDGRFYALNAYSGHVRWSFDARAKISGSPTVLGSVVYFAALGSHQTYGLDAARGRIVFQRNTGSFDPVISDGLRLYLSGTSGLFAFVPGRPARRKTPGPSAPTAPTTAARGVLAGFCADPLLRTLTRPGPAVC